MPIPVRPVARQTAADNSTEEIRKRNVERVWNGFFSTYQGPAAIMIQKTWRGYSTRKYLRALKRGKLLRSTCDVSRLRSSAAVVVQRMFRGWRTRRRLKKLVAAAKAFQRAWRVISAIQLLADLRDLAIRRRAAVLTIQRYVRGYLVRCQLRRKRRRADVWLTLGRNPVPVKAKVDWRSNLPKRPKTLHSGLGYFARRNAAATVIQRCYRGFYGRHLASSLRKQSSSNFPPEEAAPDHNPAPLFLSSSSTPSTTNSTSYPAFSSHSAPEKASPLKVDYSTSSRTLEPESLADLKSSFLSAVLSAAGREPSSALFQLSKRDGKDPPAKVSTAAAEPQLVASQSRPVRSESEVTSVLPSKVDEVKHSGIQASQASALSIRGSPMEASKTPSQPPLVISRSMPVVSHVGLIPEQKDNSDEAEHSSAKVDETGARSQLESSSSAGGRKVELMDRLDEVKLENGQSRANGAVRTSSSALKEVNLSSEARSPPPAAGTSPTSPTALKVLNTRGSQVQTPVNGSIATPMKVSNPLDLKAPSKQTQSQGLRSPTKPATPLPLQRAPSKPTTSTKSPVPSPKELAQIRSPDLRSRSSELLPASPTSPRMKELQLPESNQQSVGTKASAVSRSTSSLQALFQDQSSEAQAPSQQPQPRLLKSSASITCRTLARSSSSGNGSLSNNYVGSSNSITNSSVKDGVRSMPRTPSELWSRSRTAATSSPTVPAANAAMKSSNSIPGDLSSPTKLSLSNGSCVRRTSIKADNSIDETKELTSPAPGLNTLRRSTITSFNNKETVASPTRSQLLERSSSKLQPTRTSNKHLGSTTAVLHGVHPLHAQIMAGPKHIRPVEVEKHAGQQ